MAGDADRGPEQGEAVSEHDPRDDYDDEPWRDRPSPHDLVRLPASMMGVFGLLQCILTQLYIGVGVVTTVLGWVDDGKGVGDVLGSSTDLATMLLLFAAWLMATACTILVMRGASDLTKFRRYPWVVAGAILTLLSLPFVYLAAIQVPLGIWLIALLSRRDVRARFQAVAHRQIIDSRN
jgi:hypothetical protein